MIALPRGAAQEEENMHQELLERRSGNAREGSVDQEEYDAHKK
jgi:hypothetical protein